MLLIRWRINREGDPARRVPLSVYIVIMGENLHNAFFAQMELPVPGRFQGVGK